eukprot:7088869-Pyramimonas_sp.AAC.1
MAIRIVSVHAPHCGYSLQELDDFYSDLKDLVKEGQRTDIYIVIGGDFNTQLDVGSRSELLREFVAEFDLFAPSDFSEQSGANMWAFKSTLGVTRQLDYVLVSKSMAVSRYEASNDLDCGSDHRFVCASARVPDIRKRRVSKRKVRWQ